MTSIETIVNRQILKWELEKKETEQIEEDRPRPSPIVTISRQSGSRGSYFGSRLAQRLGYQRLHRDAIDLICESSGYRKRIIESLDGRFRGRLELLAEAIVTGQIVDLTDYARQLCKVVLSMSELGGVVLMGRGGNFILGSKRGFHLRVICPREKRIENLIKYKKMTTDEASTAIDRSDENRRKFAEELFGFDIDDPRQYDMVINSSLIDVEDMVNIAVIAIKAKMSKLTYLDHDQL
ncbi:MAG: cytidylate kinase-like family protein [candidate division Zixibacteria bacterium]|nr:cytidylate kinase-like family protein [candidate division Zixibacteria bacterium]